MLYCNDIHILLVEDDADVRRGTAAVLEKAGFNVSIASSAEEALQMVRTGHPQIVLLDWDMPGIDGLETCRRIKHAQELANVLVVIYSGAHTESEEQADGLDSGADGFIAGPVGNRELVARMESFARIWRLNRALHDKTSELEMGNASLRQRRAAEINMLEDAVAAQKQAEQALASLRESEKIFEHFMLNSPIYIFFKDAKRRPVMLSKNYETMLRKPSAELLGKPMDELFPSDLAQKMIADDMNALQGGAVVMTEEEFDGRSYATTRFPIVIDGNTRYLAGFAIDVTERKQQAQLLEDSEKRFRGLVEQSIAGIYIIQDGKVAYANPRYAEIHGFESADELIGSDRLPQIAEKDRATLAELHCKLLAGEVQNVYATFTDLRKDGTPVEVGVSGYSATYRGRPAIIGMMQDISDKKRAEERIQNYVKQLHDAFTSTVKVVTTLSELRDPYTAGHERRVAEIAVAIGTELGFSEPRLEGLRVAGNLHDVGKTTVPAEILAKPGKLSALEFSLIQGHAQAGYDVLKNARFPWPVADIALQHHERIDGTGYPQGLKGDQILLEARIVAVADVVEAMASHRPYRPGLGIDKALAEIERGRGTAYDASVADACLRLFREKRFQIPA